MDEIDLFSAIDISSADEAYERVLLEALALNPDLLLPINLDVGPLLLTAVRVSQRLPAYFDELRALPPFQVERIAKFPDYILALFSAQSRYTFATTPTAQFPELLERGVYLRDRLVAASKSLAIRGLLTVDLLNDLMGTHSYRTVACDLSRLTRMLTTNWDTVAAHTDLTTAEMEASSVLALRLMAVVAHRENAPVSVAAAAEIRQRLFTLLHLAYDEVRRAIGYIRWDQEDVEAIVPSLYERRRHSYIALKTRGGSQEVDEDSSGATITALGDVSRMRRTSGPSAR